MHILGHGVDVVDIARLGRWVDDPRDPLLPRCFIQEELDEVCRGPNRLQHLAGRFAAKEAVLKALGTGFAAGVGFSDVIIHRKPGRSPRVQLRGSAERLAEELGIVEWHLSISHTETIAMASAIAIGHTHHSREEKNDASTADDPM